MQSPAPNSQEGRLRRFTRGRTFSILLPLLLALVTFLVAYSAAADLPVLGDGAFHVFIMDEIAESGSVDTDVVVPYPLFYHLFGAFVEMLFGVTGVKLISPIMMALSALVVYLIAVELTGSKPLGLAAMFLIAFSAKLISYDVQIYMEPFGVFFILAAVYSALLFYRKQSMAALIFASLCLGMAVSTKQQALFLGLAIPVFLLVNRIPVHRIAILVGVTSLIALGPYLALWGSIGGLDLPPSTGSIFERTPAPATQDGILDDLHLQGGSEEVPQWSIELDEESEASELYEEGTRDHESRHIYMWDMYNPVRFLDLNSLHSIESLTYAPGAQSFAYALVRFEGFLLLQIMLIAGFLFALGYAVRHREWRIVPLVIVFSWFFTYWGSDTERYFLHLPVFMALLYPWPLLLASQNFELSRHKIVSGLLILATGACAFYSVHAGVGQLREERELENRQCYHESIGGMASIEDVGFWIEENTEETERLFGTSIYEWTYYTDREVWQDFRIYFLDEDRIHYYLTDVWDIKYILVRENQIIDDHFWNHLEYYPQTFYDRIKDNYELVYTSSYEDIWVYSVE